VSEFKNPFNVWWTGTDGQVRSFRCATIYEARRKAAELSREKLSPQVGRLTRVGDCFVMRRIDPGTQDIIQV